MRNDIAHEVAKTFWLPVTQTRSTEGKKNHGTAKSQANYPFSNRKQTPKGHSKAEKENFRSKRKTPANAARPSVSDVYLMLYISDSADIPSTPGVSIERAVN